MGFSVIPEPAISGFTGPTGAAGAKGDPGVIQSINGKSAASVTLAASDVNALPSNANATVAATYINIDRPAGNYRAFRWLTDGVSRWEAQVDDVAEAGSAAGSDFRLSARNDDGTFNKTVIHAKRSDGTITFGTTVHHGTAQVTSAGALGLRDLTVDPATTTGGVFLYSKAGLPYIKQADGTVFQVGTGGGTAPVTSVNTKTGAVVLAASDVGALPTTGGTLSGELSVNGTAGTYREFSFKSGGVKRWSFQADNTAEPADGSGSDFRIFSRKDDGTFNLNGLSITRKWAQTTFGDGSPLGDAKATTGGAHGLRNMTWEPALPNEGFLLYAQNGLPYIKQGDGTVFKVEAASVAPVSSVNTKTGAVVLTASDVSAVPASSVGAASGVAQLDSTTRLPIGQIPAVVAKNEWTPQALGFQAWSLDPATLATPTTGRAITIGRTYLAGFNITEPTTVSKLFVFAAGWAGSTAVPAARFFAGLYKEDGTSVISSGTTALSNVGAAGQTTGSPTVQQNSHAGAVPFPFTGSVTLQPGRYWGAFLMSAGATTDFYYFYAQNEAATNTSIFHNLSSAFIRNAYVSGMANLTTALTKANFQLNHDQMVMALA
jgi:hypothetical protein